MMTLEVLKLGRAGDEPHVTSFLHKSPYPPVIVEFLFTHTQPRPPRDEFHEFRVTHFTPMSATTTESVTSLTLNCHIYIHQ